MAKIAEKVLIAEGCRTSAQRLIAVLQSEGISDIQVVQSGVKALVLAEQDAYDLVILGNNLDELCGMEVSVKLRDFEGYDEVPVISLLSSSTMEDIKQVRAASFDGWMAKPLDYPKVVKFLGAISYFHSKKGANIGW